MIISGLLWIAIFAAASVSLPDLRHLLRRGSFVADARLQRSRVKAQPGRERP